jgi:hypothetical protein
MYLLPTSFDLESDFTGLRLDHVLNPIFRHQGMKYKDTGSYSRVEMYGVFPEVSVLDMMNEFLST